MFRAGVPTGPTCGFWSTAIKRTTLTPRPLKSVPHEQPIAADRLLEAVLLGTAVIMGVLWIITVA